MANKKNLITRRTRRGGASAWNKQDLAVGDYFTMWWKPMPGKVSPAPTQGGAVQSLTSSIIASGSTLYDTLGASNRPTYNTSSVSFASYPSITFDGVNDRLVSSGSTTVHGNMTIWWVGKNLSTASRRADVVHQTSGFTTAVGWDGGNNTVYWKYAGAEQLLVTASAGVGSPHSWTLTVGTNLTASIYRDGTLLASSGVSYSLTSGSGTHALGGASAVASGSNMEIAEAGRAGRVLSASEVATFHNDYVRSRYGFLPSA
jgi:hypothetical protein